MIMKVKAIGLLASIMTLCACGSGQMVNAVPNLKLGER